MLIDIIKRWFSKNQKMIIIISIMFIIFALGNYTVYKLVKCKKIKCEPIIEHVIDEPEKKEISKEEIYHFVDIKGAVKNPGVYKLTDGSRIADAIEIAGGLSKNANTVSLNLSKKITDGMYIVIYTKEQIKKFNESSKKLVCPENICVCPEVEINDACASAKESKDTIISNYSENSIKSNDKVSINSATEEMLLNLPGIGESKAKTIIEYRNKNGVFEKIEDITKVSGIGESVYEKIKDLITL